jgi:hypothetical protein
MKHARRFEESRSREKRWMCTNAFQVSMTARDAARVTRRDAGGDTTTRITEASRVRVMRARGSMRLSVGLSQRVHNNFWIFTREGPLVLRTSGSKNPEASALASLVKSPVDRSREFEPRCSTCFQTPFQVSIYVHNPDNPLCRPRSRRSDQIESNM